MSPAPVEVRQLTAEHIDSLINLRLKVRAKAVAGGMLPVIDLNISTRDLKSQLENTIKDPDKILAGALRGSKLLGTGQVNFNNDRRRVCLGSFEIDPEYQGTGIALAFIKFAIRKSRRDYPMITHIEAGRYNMSENNRRKDRPTLFDRIAGMAGVTIEDSIWNSEPIKWYIVPIPLAERLLRLRIEASHDSFLGPSS